jgi:hypothetical protein
VFRIGRPEARPDYDRLVLDTQGAVGATTEGRLQTFSRCRSPIATIHDTWLGQEMLLSQARKTNNA